MSVNFEAIFAAFRRRSDVADLREMPTRLRLHVSFNRRRLRRGFANPRRRGAYFFGAFEARAFGGKRWLLA